jgi:hypothetical protein
LSLGIVSLKEYCFGLAVAVLEGSHGLFIDFTWRSMLRAGVRWISLVVDVRQAVGCRLFFFQYRG